MADHRLAIGRGHKRSALALLYAESGRIENARAEFEALAAQRFEGLRRDSNYAYNLALLSETCAQLGDVERAALLFERLEPWAGRYVGIPSVVTAGCGSRFLGRLAAVMQRWDVAAKHFEDALGVERQMQARLHEARALHDYAAMLRARAAPGDRQMASDYVARARAIEAAAP